MDKLVVPRHVSIIMDGNGRWAQKRFLPRVAGHRKGVEAARQVVDHCINKNIHALTLFAFSSENWQRPQAEVNLLMSILKRLLAEEVSKLHEHQVKLRVVGDITRLQPELQAAIQAAETTTQNNTGLQLNIAFNYGGRWDITQATRAIAAAVQAGELEVADITEDTMQSYMMLNDVPPPDLLIRTSGEQRISNFMLWQHAYSELYFTPTLWPDFGPNDIDEALAFFNQRQRRFGLTSEQLKIKENV